MVHSLVRRLIDGDSGAWSDLQHVIEICERKNRFPTAKELYGPCHLNEPNKELVEAIYSVSPQVAFACYLITVHYEYFGGM